MKWFANISFSTKWLLASVLATLLLFPHLHLGVTTDPDGALAWMMNAVPDRGSDWGAFVFPHGPLVWLIHPIELGFNLWAALVFYTVSRCMFLWLVLKRMESLEAFNSWRQALIWVMATLLLFMITMQAMPYFILLALALHHMAQPRRKWLIALAAFTGVAVLIKTNIAVYAVLNLLVVAVFEALNRRFTRAMTTCIASFLVAVACWLFIYGPTHLNELYPFIKGSLSLLFGNEGAMTLAKDRWWLLAMGGAFLLLLMPVSKPKQGHWFWLLTLPILLASWKHGMVRHDLFHAWAFWLQLLAVLGLLVLCTARQTWVTAALAVFCSASFVFAFDLAIPNFQDRGWVRNSPLGWRTLTASDSVDTRHWEMTSEAQGMCWDVYPYDYSYLRFNDLAVCPKPVVQSYAANTRFLDQLNANYFSNEGPERLIWHADRRGQFTSIDGRYSWSDAPRTTASILKHYGHLRTTSNALVFERLNGKLNELDTVRSDSFQVHAEQWQAFPLDPAAWYNASFDLEHKSLRALMGAKLHRGRPVFVNLKSTAGDERVFRLHATLDIDGVVLSPLFELWQNDVLLTQMDSFRLIYDTNWYEPTYWVRMQQVTWSDSLMAHPAIALKSIKAERPEEIAPGGFSRSIQVDFDSIGCGAFRAKSFVHIGAASVPMAQLVVEWVVDGVQTSDRAYINTMQTGGAHYFASIDLPIEVCDPQSIQVKAYLWNAGEEAPIQLESMRLSVQKFP